MKKSKPLSLKYLLYDFIRITAAIPGFIWFRPKRIYESKEAKKIAKGGALIMANHNTLFDPLYLLFGYWKRREHFIAMTELFGSKFSRWVFRYAFLCIEIDRQNFSMTSFKEITDNLKAGNVLTIFPEGKVNENRDGNPQDFKGGMIMMALRGNAPIIPIYVKKKEHFYNRLVFAIGNPVDLKTFKEGGIKTKQDIEEAVEYLKQKEIYLQGLCFKNKKQLDSNVGCNKGVKN